MLQNLLKKCLKVIVSLRFEQKGSVLMKQIKKNCECIRKNIISKSQICSENLIAGVPDPVTH